MDEKERQRQPHNGNKNITAVVISIQLGKARKVSQKTLFVINFNGYISAYEMCNQGSRIYLEIGHVTAQLTSRWHTTSDNLVISSYGSSTEN